jgi:U32 family peptidase
MSPKSELMAPAGGPEAAFAAFHHGADAVYLGLRRFSARADAENFGPEDLEAVIAFAHAQTPRRKVYAAVNTLVLQSELPDLAEDLGLLADLGADAIIVQDLGVARMARRHFGSLRLHGSTQLAVHNPQGVEALRGLGFSRATLARELTLDEIRAAAAVPGIEVESFVHGALCYCYSGLCLFSSMTTGRSGNRGKCAYLCRDRFSEESDQGGRGRFVFSMKDLALSHAVPDLCGAGVASLKVEGRKKSPLYVAAVTALYRGLIDGTLSPEERSRIEADLQAIFSRPWTELFVDSRRNLDVVDAETVGHRGTPIGRVTAVIPGPGGRRLRFQTSRDIERHDGLQVDVPGSDRPFGFPVDRLFTGLGDARMREVFEAPAGSLVEVELPPDAPRMPEASPVYCSSSQLVKRNYRVPIPTRGRPRVRSAMSVKLAVRPDGMRADAEAAGPAGETGRLRVSVESQGALSPSREPARTEDAAREAFGKLGDTRWKLDALDLDNPSKLFVPVSRLNELRRNVGDRLEGEYRRAQDERRGRVASALEADRSGSTAGAIPGARWSIKADDPAELAALEPEDWRGIDEVIVDIGPLWREVLSAALADLGRKAGRDRVRLALPLITRAWEEKDLDRKISAFLVEGWTKWQAANLSALSFLPAEGLDVTADWSLYSLNAQAVRAWREAGVSGFTFSPEDGIENLRALLPGFGGEGTVIVYQDTPLFVSEACERLTATGTCPGLDRCDFREEKLVSSHGDRVLAVNRRCRTWVIGQRPLCWADRIAELEAAGARRFRADFLLRKYAPADVRDLWRLLRLGAAPRGSHAGNYARGLA